MSMKKDMHIALRHLFIIASLFMALSCSGPRNYVVKAVKLMDRHGLFAEGPEWEVAKKEALGSRPENMDDAHEVVKNALSVAGGKHSFIYPADMVNKDAANTGWEMPSITIDGNNIAMIKLPPFHGNREEGIRYASSVIESIPDDIAGAIIDLRHNTGGDMYPMIAAVHRFIRDGDKMLRFRSRKRTQWIPLAYVCSVAGIESRPHIDCPVAILTDSLTASSGEATLLCFRGQENAKTFGGETAGYASANTPYAMPDGSSLVLTTGCDVARTDESFCDEPIAPDAPTSSPETAATTWLLN